MRSILGQVDVVHGLASPQDPSGAAPTAINPQDAVAWGLTFRQFSVAHLVTVLCCLGVISAVVYIGRRQRKLNNLARGAVDGPGQMLGALLIAYWVVLQVWWIIPVRTQRDSWLPLQLCDLAGLVGGLALLTGNRLLTTTLYFWGFALSTQAFFTPIITVGSSTARFWLFWESHTAIIGSAVYVVAVRGYRPNWRDLRVGVAMTVLYFVVVLPLDLRFGWNYGYIGPSKPGQAATVLDRLGPWPWRLAPLSGLAVGAMLLAWLPWVFADKFGRKEADVSPEDGGADAALSAGGRRGGAAVAIPPGRGGQ